MEIVFASLNVWIGFLALLVSILTLIVTILKLRVVRRISERNSCPQITELEAVVVVDVRYDCSTLPYISDFGFQCNQPPTPEVHEEANEDETSGQTKKDEEG